MESMGHVFLGWLEQYSLNARIADMLLYYFFNMIGLYVRMNVNEMSKYVQKVLIRSGWYPERKYDTTFWVSNLEQEGYRLNEYANLILKELGNIYVREQSTEMHVSATFDFNPYDSASEEYDRIEEFELASKDKIFPIGSLQDYIVYAGESKKYI